MSRLTMKDTPWATEILREGAELLNRLGLKWWVSAGTLLGIHREGHLIDHDDPDIDVGVEEVVNHEAIKEAFFERDFELFAEGMHQIVFKKDKVLFDIYFYKQKDDLMVCEIFGLGVIEKPYSLFDKLGTIRFEDTLYPCPTPVDEYLTVRYGDWRTPKTKKEPWENETPALKKY